MSSPDNLSPSFRARQIANGGIPETNSAAKPMAAESMDIGWPEQTLMEHMFTGEDDGWNGMSAVPMQTPPSISPAPSPAVSPFMQDLHPTDSLLATSHLLNLVSEELKTQNQTGAQQAPPPVMPQATSPLVQNIPVTPPIQNIPPTQEIPQQAVQSAAAAPAPGLRDTALAGSAQVSGNTPEKEAAKEIQKFIDEIEDAQKKEEDDQGIIGGLVHHTKNLFNTKNSSEKVNEDIDKLKEKGEALYKAAKDGDSVEFAKLYQELTGEVWGQPPAPGSENEIGGDLKKLGLERVQDYKQSQDTWGSTTIIIGASLAAVGAAAAIFTGGASLGLTVAGCAMVGAATAGTLSVADDVTGNGKLDKGWKHHASLVAQGAVAGAVAPIGGAAGSAVARATTLAAGRSVTLASGQVIAGNATGNVLRGTVSHLASRAGWQGLRGSTFTTTTGTRAAGAATAGTVDGGLSSTGIEFVKTGDLGHSLKAGLYGAALGGAIAGGGSGVTSAFSRLHGQSTAYDMEVGRNFFLH